MAKNIFNTFTDFISSKFKDYPTRHGHQEGQGQKGQTTRQEQPSETGRLRFHGFTRPLTQLGYLGLAFTLISIGYEAIWIENRHDIHLRMVLPVIGLAGFVFGLLVGFLIAPHGDEKATFGPLWAVINGVLGGFTLADLTKDDSMIKAGLHSLARSAGVEGVGFVITILVFFGVVGFLCGYINKQYILNVSLGQTREVEEKVKRIENLTKNITLVSGEAERKPQLSKEDREKLRARVETFAADFEDEKLFRDVGKETIKAYAKALYLLEDWEKCEKVLRKARLRGDDPDDPDLLLYLANVLCRIGSDVSQSRNDQSGIPYFQKAVSHMRALEVFTHASVATFKILGYAYLFISGKLNESEAATNKYLAIHPEDIGAKVNLACVYGQWGPTEQNIKKVVFILGPIAHIPEVQKLMQFLRQPNGDFALWNDVSEFVALFGPLQGNSNSKVDGHDHGLRTEHAGPSLFKETEK